MQLEPNAGTETSLGIDRAPRAAGQRHSHTASHRQCEDVIMDLHDIAELEDTPAPSIKNDAPAENRSAWNRARGNRKPSLREAINKTCHDCIYDSKSGLGTWREQVAQCSCTSCGLWLVRTGPESGPHVRAKADLIAISTGQHGPTRKRAATT